MSINSQKSLYSMEKQIEAHIASINTNCDDVSRLSSLEKQQTAALLEILGTNLGLVKKGLKVGILKKIESMDLKDLQVIAIRSLSIFVEGADPETFIIELQKLKKRQKEDLEEFETGQKEELKRRRALVSSLEFEVVGPTLAFVDFDGNPTTDLIINEKTLLGLKDIVKKYPFSTRRLFNVKVPKDYFSDSELLDLVSYGYEEKGFIKKTIYISEETLEKFLSNLPGFVSLLQNEFGLTSLSEEQVRELCKSTRFGIDFAIKITPDLHRKEQFDYRYSNHSKPQKDDRIEGMEVILPEIMKKKELLSDGEKLKRYIQELLVGSEFINWYASIDENNPMYQPLQQLKGSELSTFFTEEEFNTMIRQITLSDSKKRSQQLFRSPTDVVRCKNYINRIRQENKKQANYRSSNLWLKARNLTIKQIDRIKNSKVFKRTFYSRREAYVSGLLQAPDFLTEDDLKNLEQNKEITKEINGITVSLGLDYSRIKGMTKYSDERNQQSNEFSGDLKAYIASHRKAIEQLRMIDLCDRQLEELRVLQQKLPKPISTGAFQL